MQGAHEHRNPPERNAAAEQSVAQRCEYLVSLHRRPRTIDEPIHGRPYIVSRHPSACELPWTLIVAHAHDGCAGDPVRRRAIAPVRSTVPTVTAGCTLSNS